MVELDDGACGHLPHTALPSKLTSPLASALHFQTYFSSRWSTSLPNLLLLSLQHVTSKLLPPHFSLPNLLAAPLAAALHFQTYFLAPLASALHFQTYFSSHFSTSHPNLLLSRSLQHFTAAKLTANKCSLFSSFLFSSPPPMHSTSLNTYSSSHFGAQPHTHTHSMHALVQRQDKTILSNGCEWREPVQMYTQIACLLTQSLSHTGSTSLPHLLLLSLRHSATHTHIACTLSFNDRTRLASRMFVSGESQSKCTHRLPVYLLNLSLTQAALHFRTYFSSHFDTQPHTHT